MPQNEDVIFNLIRHMFKREEIGGVLDEKAVALNDYELALVKAWMGAKDVADILAGEQNIVDRALIGALFMLQAIYVSDEVATAVANYAPLKVWVKLIANSLLSVSKGKDELTTKLTVGTTLPQVSGDVGRYDEQSLRMLLVNAALLAAEEVVRAKDDSWWDVEDAPVAAAVIISHACHVNPNLLDAARCVPIMSVVRDALLSDAVELTAR